MNLSTIIVGFFRVRKSDGSLDGVIDDNLRVHQEFSSIVDVCFARASADENLETINRVIKNNESD